ncbi:MAG: hypothetical protein BWY54_01008 [Candidatus Dependentiae bacterium ADurb.Bin331]|nr:MAG: hypothetical protein BWY54_01008 [Candidatus Dependentiae bacterium ADurb.Bin331]
MRAPIERNNAIRSITSGSNAALTMRVLPCVNVAAMSKFSVAPILGYSKIKFAHFSCAAWARKNSPSTSRETPIFAKFFKWKSIGRAPIKQPPGSAISALPKRANSGPITSTDARIFFIIEGGTWHEPIFVVSTSRTFNSG